MTHSPWTSNANNSKDRVTNTHSLINSLDWVANTHSNSSLCRVGVLNTHPISCRTPSRARNEGESRSSRFPPYSSLFRVRFSSSRRSRVLKVNNRLVLLLARLELGSSCSRARANPQ